MPGAMKRAATIDAEAVREKTGFSKTMFAGTFRRRAPTGLRAEMASAGQGIDDAAADDRRRSKKGKSAFEKGAGIATYRA
jgi:hypothetical protein